MKITIQEIFKKSKTFMLVSKKSYSDLCKFMREFCKIFSCTDPTTLCVKTNQ